MMKKNILEFSKVSGNKASVSGECGLQNQRNLNERKIFRKCFSLRFYLYQMPFSAQYQWFKIFVIASRQNSHAKFSQYKLKIDEPLLSKSVKYDEVCALKRNSKLFCCIKKVSLNCKIWLVRNKPFAQKTCFVRSISCSQKQWQVFVTLRSAIRCWLPRFFAKLLLQKCW